MTQDIDSRKLKGGEKLRAELTKWSLWVAVGMIATVMVAGKKIEAAGGSGARSLGLAGAYTGVARNLDAIDWNPANLGLPSRHFGSSVLILPSFALGLGNNAFCLDLYEKYNGKYLTEQDKKAILDLIRDGLKIYTNLQYDILGLSVWRIGFKNTIESTFDLTLTQGPFEFALRGTEVGKTVRLDDLGAELCVLNRTSVSYAHPLSNISAALREELDKLEISQLSVGLTLNYLAGLAYASLETPKGQIRFDNYYVHGSGEAIMRAAGVEVDSTDGGQEIKFRPGKIGSGFSLDVGVAATVKKNFTVGLSLMNLGGEINWEKYTREFRFSFSADSLNMVKVAQDTTGGDSLYTTADSSYAIDPFKSRYPTYLNLGVAYRLNPEKIGENIRWLADELVLAFDWRQGFSDGMGISRKARFAFGLETGLLWGYLPFRLGLALGGQYGVVGTYGIGLKLGAFTCDLAFENRGHLFSSSAAKGKAVAMQCKFAF